jgi:gamma-glutamyl-gamma-aminobutyrate hydrolase PuuD
MPKIAITFSPEVGGLSVESLRSSFLDVGCDVKNADFRAIMRGVSEQDFKEAYQTHEGRMKLLAHAKANAQEFFETYQIDCLALSGNNDMIDPILFGEERDEHAEYDYGRTIAELALTHVATQRGIPIIGLCGGHQVLAVYGGGKLRAMTIEEIQQQKLMTYDTVWVKEDSLLGNMIQPVSGTKKTKDATVFLKREYFGSHNQVVSKLGKDCVETAHSSDKNSLNEAVEKQHGAPVLTTQFHPEIGFKGLPMLAIYRARTSRVAENKSIFSYFKHAAQTHKNKQACLDELKKLNQTLAHDGSLQPTNITRPRAPTPPITPPEEPHEKMPRWLSIIMDLIDSLTEIFHAISRYFLSSALMEKVILGMKLQEQNTTTASNEPIQSNQDYPHTSHHTMHTMLGIKEAIRTPEDILTHQPAKKWASVSSPQETTTESLEETNEENNHFALAVMR